MTCLKPITGYYTPDGPEGRPTVTFGRSGLKRHSDARMIPLPCRTCPSCKRLAARNWTVRMYHEMQMHEENTFITPTYDEEHLPKDGLLRVEHHQTFMKSYRKHVERLGTHEPFKFYACGEYGEENKRPHYHYIIFGHDFEDKLPWSTSGAGNNQWKSPSLSKIWGKGRIIIGTAELKSLSYTAGYVQKKSFGAEADEEYSWNDPETGEIKTAPPFQAFSKDLGKKWLEKYYEDLYPHNFVLVAGQKYSIPPAYDRWMEKNHPLLLDETLHRRYKFTEEQSFEDAKKGVWAENGVMRQATKMEIQKIALARNKRDFD